VPEAVIFSKSCNTLGAISSSVIGLSVTIILYIMGMPSPSAGTIGMITSLAINPIFSYIWGMIKN